jgi:ATP-binding cassette subfamily B multidrug efflux pump
MASWGRMLEVMDAVPEISDDEVTERGRTIRVRGDIRIENLTFTYPGTATPVLSGLTLHIPAGTTAAFVGGTGSGKSTLIALLPRLHQPPPGTIFPLATLRAAIGFVPQEPFLFSDSLAENIAFGRIIERDDERQAILERAASVARLDKDVAEFRDGYGTVIGERGITLSGGQKQRTAIARALFVDPPILVLDDALSAVDTYTEDEILGRLKDVMRERTAIIVAHRVSTVRHADQIFVLDGGRIAEQGTHDELVAGGGIYASMYRKQLLQEELEAS